MAALGHRITIIREQQFWKLAAPKTRGAAAQRLGKRGVKIPPHRLMNEPESACDIDAPLAVVRISPGLAEVVGGLQDRKSVV